MAEAPVGHNLHDHIGVAGLNVVFPEGKGYRDLSLREIWKFLSNHTGPLRVPGGTQAVGFYRSASEGLVMLGALHLSLICLSLI